MTTASGMSMSPLTSTVKMFNSLTAYHYTDEQFDSWSRIITMARPHTTKNEILNVIVRLASGDGIEVDSKLGVQNILRNLFTEKEKQDAEARRINEAVECITNHSE